MIWDWNFAWKIMPTLLGGLLVTIEATLFASVLAMLLGLAMALGRRSPIRTVRIATASAVEFIRRTPVLVQIYFAFYVLPDVGITLSPLTAGVISLSVHYSAYISEVYRAGIEGIPKGQWEAAKALNYSSFHIWTRIIIPQAIPPIVPPLGNYVISMYKQSALLSVITVVELMNSARIIADGTYRYFEPMTMVGLLFLVVSLPSAFALRRLEMRLSGRIERRSIVYESRA